MRKRGLAIAFIAIIFCVIGFTVKNKKILNINITNYKQLTQKEKLDDFQYMYTILKDNYPFFEVNKRLNGVDWLLKKNQYISQIKATNNDDSFFKVLQSVLAELNNAHTDMLDKNFYSYAGSVYSRNQNVNGEWLKQLDNLKAIKRYNTMPDKGNKLNISSNSITPNNVKTKILSKDKVAYLSIHMFNTFNINGDMKLIKPYIQSIKNYKALIIDIRGNGVEIVAIGQII